MRLVLSGYYGFGNAGDDAILEAIVADIHRHDQAAQITVVAYPYGDTRAVERSVGLSALDGQDIGRVAEVIGGADGLVIGGGGLLHDYLPSDPATHFSPRSGNLAFWTTLALLARSAGKPVATWALGLGPLATPEGRDHAALFFEQVGLVTVRDAASARLARDLGIPADRLRLTADPTLLLDPPESDPFPDLAAVEDLPHGGARRICVAVRSWRGDEAWQSELAAGLDVLSERLDADVLFVPFQHAGKGLDNDALVATRIAARMHRTGRRAVVGADLSPREKLGLLGRSDLVVAMRLHAVHFAAAGGVAVVALSYDPKVALAMEELTLGDLVVPLDQVSSPGLVDKALTAVDLSEDRRTAYRQTWAELRERASEAGRAVFEFLAHPVLPPASERTITALGAAAVARAAEVVATETRLDRAEADLSRTSTELANLTEAYDKMASQYQSLLDARAVRLVRSMWTLRDRIRRLPSSLLAGAKALARPLLPARARRALRAAVGGSRPAVADAFSNEEIERFRGEIAASLSRIVEAHRDAPGFVVMPPGIGWTVELFQRPQQMALAFARLGYPVLYHLEAKYRDGLVGYRPLGNGIYAGYVPERLEDLLAAVPQPIFLSYVYNFAWSKHLDRPVTVYEHIDHLEVFEHVYLRRDLDAWHRAALADADVVAPSAVDLLAEVKEARPDAVLVPNGVDYEHFEGSGEAPEDMRPLLDGRPVVGYYGALAEWFDYDLLEEVARRLPEHHFVLIGPDYDGTAARSAAFHLPNVHWLGPRPYATLPDYLACFDVATVPFKVNEVTHAVSPLKLFEYMAGGKPVVTPPLRECARYRVVQIGDGPEGFAEQVVRAVSLGKDPEHIALLRRTARANTWEARVRTILEAVERRRAAGG